MAVVQLELMMENFIFRSLYSKLLLSTRIHRVSLSLQEQVSLLEVGRVKLNLIIEVIISKVHKIIFQRNIEIILPP